MAYIYTDNVTLLLPGVCTIVCGEVCVVVAFVSDYGYFLHVLFFMVLLYCVVVYQ